MALSGSGSKGEAQEKPSRRIGFVSHNSFDQRVYAAVALIPHGQLATYGQIAALIGAPGSARQVGWALKRLQLPSPLPWHRVVNAKGEVSMGINREGSDWIQRQRLIAEGIPVSWDGRLPLRRYLWSPPPPPLA